MPTVRNYNERCGDHRAACRSAWIDRLRMPRLHIRDERAYTIAAGRRRPVAATFRASAKGSIVSDAPAEKERVEPHVKPETFGSSTGTLSPTRRLSLIEDKTERNRQMTMNDPNDDIARRNMDARPRVDDRPRMDARPAWVVPAIVGAVLVAGFLVFTMSGDRPSTATKPATETTGRSERAPAPPATPLPANPKATTPQPAPEAPRAQ
jgi:hypothetical protein